MEVRAAIKYNPAIASIATSVIIICAVVAIVFQMRAGGMRGSLTEQYFTIDDGATYFADDIHKIAPFSYNGKVALRAFVFKGQSGKPWVQYLGRYKPAMKAKLEAMAQDKNVSQADFIRSLGDDYDVKPPLTGDTGWADMYSPKGSEICEIRLPPGVQAPFEAVFP